MYLTPSGPARSARPGRPLTGLAGLAGAPGAFVTVLPQGMRSPGAAVTPMVPPGVIGNPFVFNPGPIVRPTPPIIVAGRICVTGDCGTGAPPTGSPTNANTAGTPVPPGYPTNQIYVDPATGAFYEYSATQNAWIDVGVPYNTGQPPGASSGNTYAGTPVPSTQPTGAPYRDSGGNYWVFNGQAWTNEGASGYFPGTSIPISTPTNQLYTDSFGNQWTYSNGNWQLVASPSSTTSSFSPDGSPASSAAYTGGGAAIAPESGTQSLLDWFSQTTLISGVPNWVLAAGAGIVALKLMKGGKR